PDPNLTPVRPEDLIPQVRELRIQRRDLLVVRMPLIHSPSPVIQTAMVNAEGFVKLPNIEPVRVAGMTPTEAKKILVASLSDEHPAMDDDAIDVQVRTARSRSTFRLLDGKETFVYEVPLPDFRLLNALATVGGVPGRVRQI